MFRKKHKLFDSTFKMNKQHDNNIIAELKSFRPSHNFTDILTLLNTKYCTAVHNSFRASVFDDRRGLATNARLK